MMVSTDQVKRNQTNNSSFTLLLLSIAISLLVVYVSYAGLYTPGMYARETANWRLQTVTQDAVDIWFVIPCLVMATILVLHKRETGFFLWGGTNIYLVYTFAIYCFDLHFNHLFLIYSFILGLSFYSVLYFLFSISRRAVPLSIYKNIPVKISAGYLVVISISFYLLWLSAIIPAISNNSVPKELTDVGLLTNPVHVLDLSIVLPAFFITAVLIYRKKRIGILLAPAILAFSALMDVTICVLVIAMNSKGMGSGYTIVGIIGTQAIISIILLILFLRSMNNAVL